MRMCVFSALVFVLMLSLLIVFGVSWVVFFCFFFSEEDHLDQDLDLEMIKLSSKFVRYLFV